MNDDDRPPFPDAPAAPPPRDAPPPPSGVRIGDPPHSLQSIARKIAAAMRDPSKLKAVTAAYRRNTRWCQRAIDCIESEEEADDVLRRLEEATEGLLAFRRVLEEWMHALEAEVARREAELAESKEPKPRAPP